MPPRVVSGIRRRFQRLSQSRGQVTHVLLTRSPLIRGASSASPFDLHVLSTPPAFVLSQDQTLRKCLNAYQGKPQQHIRCRPQAGNRPTINEFNLTDECLLTFNSIQRNPNQPDKPTGRGLLALTIVHAVEFSRIGRTSPTRLTSSNLRHLDRPGSPADESLRRIEDLSACQAVGGESGSM